MAPRHIYDSEGRWVAFAVGADIFSPAGDLIGCLVQNHEVYDLEGRYLGALTEGGYYRPAGAPSGIIPARLSLPVRQAGGRQVASFPERL